jgi:hypothetical protein
MTPAARDLLAQFEAAAAAANEAEAALRKRMEREVAAAERERAFAYRRLNLMRTLTQAVESAESEEVAVASGLAAVRARLGWADDSDTRTETLDRFRPVVRTTFMSLASAEEAPSCAADPARALAEFEAWYVATYGRPFWVLFEQEIEEMPLVER